MKVVLRVNVTDVGVDGATVDVPAAQANWLIDQGYAIKAADAPTPAPTPTPAPPAPAKKSARAPRGSK